MLCRLFTNFLTAKNMNKILALLMLSAATLGVEAADLNGTVARIVANNPALNAEKARIEAETAAMQAENVLQGPEVDFDYKFGKDENKWGASLTQGFDWPGTYRARSRALEARRALAEKQLAGARLACATEAKDLLLQLQLAHFQLQLANEAADNIASLEQLYARALERGETTILEVKKLRLEAFSCATRRAEAEANLAAVEAQLTALNGGTPLSSDFSRDFEPEQLKGESEYLADISEKDPDFALACAQSAAAEQNRKVASLSAMPGFKAGYVYENEGGDSFHGFTVGISLPAWNRSNKTAAARLEKTAADETASDTLLKLKAQLTADYAAATRLEVRVQAAKDEFANAEYPRLLQKALDAGRINLFDYLREYNDYLTAKADFLDLEYRYASLVAKLNRYDLIAQ